VFQKKFAPRDLFNCINLHPPQHFATPLIFEILENTLAACQPLLVCWRWSINSLGVLGESGTEWITFFPFSQTKKYLPGFGL